MSTLGLSRNKCISSSDFSHISFGQRTRSGVSTQQQSSGLVAHENSTFRNLALTGSGPFMALMGALFDFKCACDSRKHIQVTYDAGRISA